MGAYSPAPVLTDALIAEVMRTIIEPTIATLAKRGTPFKGVLYGGSDDRHERPEADRIQPRFGDPECQVLMMRLKSDLLELLLASVEGRLDQTTADWRDEAALTVVMAAKGYPAATTRARKSVGSIHRQRMTLPSFTQAPNAMATRILANGGRVLNVTAVGTTFARHSKGPTSGSATSTGRKVFAEPTRLAAIARES